MQVCRTAIDHDLRPIIPEDYDDFPGSPGQTLDRYIDLMERCWLDEAEERPTFQRILREIKSMRGLEDAALGVSVKATGPFASAVAQQMSQNTSACALGGENEEGEMSAEGVRSLLRLLTR